MKKYCRWKDEEIKKLFSHIENCSQKGIILTEAFKLYANMTNRKQNSVRNYYYAELNNLETNKQDCKRLNINLENHKKTQANFFSDEEAKLTMEKINGLKSKGYSVRKACLSLAHGNINEMVRLQNKYRTMSKEEKSKNPALFPKNVISMPQKTMQLTEAEINSLFLGLVKLIKTSVKQEMNLKFQKDTENANSVLRQTLVNLSNKEEQYLKMKKSFDLLKAENKKLDEKVKMLRSIKVENQNEKMTALKSYTKSLESVNAKQE